MIVKRILFISLLAVISLQLTANPVSQGLARKKADALVVVGFGFGSDDEHINGMIRTLVDDDDKRLIVVTINDNSMSTSDKAERIARKLKVRNSENIKVIFVNEDGIEVKSRKKWTERLTETV